MESLRKSAIEGSFWEFIAKFVEKIGAFIFTIILARFLLPEKFGVYSLAMSVGLIFIGFFNYAINQTTIRYISDVLGKGNKKLASNYFKYILRKKILFTMMASGLLIILAYPLSVFVFKKPVLFVPLFVTGFYIFVLGIQSSYETLFYVFKEIKKRAIKESVKQILRILITTLVFLLVAKSYYVVGVIFGLILTNLLVLVLIIWYVKKFAFFILEGKEKSEIGKKRVLKFLYCLMAGGVVGIVFSYTDVLMLGIFLPEIKYVGFYFAAIGLTWGVMGMLNFSTVFLPILTQVKKKRLETTFNQVMKYVFMVSIPAAFGIAALSRYIIFLVYGREYLEASIILAFLSILIIQGVGFSFIGTLFSAREKPKFIPIGISYALVLNIILNLILINVILSLTGSQLWATLGAGIATAISKYGFIFYLIFMMNTKLKVRLKSINWIKPLFASFLMFWVLILINKILIKDLNLFLGIVEILIGMGIYFIVMILIKGVDKKDFELIKIILPDKVYK